jgi:isopentenyl-diphosphate Delta-isomerase
MRMVGTIDRTGAVGPLVGIVEAHRAGFAHRAISIVAWNSSRTRMLITRRSATKTTWPGFCSNAVCSHPLPQESSLAAARRRLFEELRILEVIVPAFRMYYGPVRCPISGVFEHELDYVFFTRLAESASVRPNSEEISAVQWVDESQLTTLRQMRETHPLVHDDFGTDSLGRMIPESAALVGGIFRGRI